MYTKQEAIELCYEADKDWIGNYYGLYSFKFIRKRYQTRLIIAFDVPDGKYKRLEIPGSKPITNPIYLPFMYKGAPCEIGFW